MTTVNWKAAIGGDWSNPARWSSGAIPAPGDDVQFGLIGNYLVTINGPEAANSIEFNAPGARLVESASGTLSAGLFVVDNGYAELNSPNVLGESKVAGGVLAVGNANALGGGDLVMAGGELLGIISETLTNQLSFTGASTIAAAHATTLNLNSSIPWHFGSNTSVDFGAPGYDGVVVWHTAAGSLGAPTNVHVRAGILKAGDASFTSQFIGGTTTIDAGAGIELAGFSTTMADLRGAGLVTSGAAATLRLNGGTLAGTIGGAINLRVAGPVTLTGANSYTGATTIDAVGTLVLGNDATAGSIAAGSAITDNGNLVAKHSNALTLANPISGSGVLTQAGSGTTIINTANTYTGGTAIFGGTLAIGVAGALGSGGVTLNGGEIEGAGNVSLANPLTINSVSTTSVVTMAAAHGGTLGIGPSPWTLNEAANANGARIVFGAPGQDGIVVWSGVGGTIKNPGNDLIEVKAGTLKAGDAYLTALLNHGPVAPGAAAPATIIDTGARVDVAGFPLTIGNLQGTGTVTDSGAASTLTLGNNSAFGGTIAGAISLHVAGNQAVFLTGANTYTGATTIDASAFLFLGNGGATGSIAAGGAITNNGELTISRSNTVILAGPISGSGDLVLDGSGTTVLNGANSYSGGTFIYSGTLAVGVTGALGSGEVHLFGGQLRENGNVNFGNVLSMANSFTIAAGHGGTLTIGSALWTLNESSGSTMSFGSAGQDGTVVWSRGAGAIINGSGDTIDLKAGTLKASDFGLAILLANSLSTTVETGATLDIAGWPTTIPSLHGTGTVTNSIAGAAVPLTLSGSPDFQGTLKGNLSLDVAADCLLRGLSAFLGGTTLEANVILSNEGSFDLTTNAGVLANGVGTQFTNDGLFDKHAGVGVSTVSTPFANNGEVAATSGSVQFTGGFVSPGVVEGLISISGGVTTVTANALGQTTFFGGSGDNLIRVTVAPTYVDGGAGFDTLEIASKMTLAAGSLLNVEAISVDNGVTANLANLAAPEIISLKSLAGGGSAVTGTQGADTITGGLGNDTYYVNHTGAKIIEAVTAGIDTIVSTISYALPVNVENLTLAGTNSINGFGNILANTITGQDGNNIIDGRGGNDTLEGLGGADSFRFDTALSGTSNVPHILDFEPGVDHVQLSHTIFSALSAGALPSTAFIGGTAAQNPDQHVIYNSVTGALLYDPDGNGPAAAVRFAMLDNHAAAASTDFYVI